MVRFFLEHYATRMPFRRASGGMCSGPFTSSNTAAIFKARDTQMKTLNFKKILKMCDDVD